jgi:hypothetical protein
MNRRRFLTALATLPVVGRLFPAKAEPACEAFTVLFGRIPTRHITGDPVVVHKPYEYVVALGDIPEPWSNFEAIRLGREMAVVGYEEFRKTLVEPMGDYTLVEFHGLTPLRHLVTYCARVRGDAAAFVRGVEEARCSTTGLSC